MTDIVHCHVTVFAPKAVLQGGRFPCIRHGFGRRESTTVTTTRHRTHIGHRRYPSRKRGRNDQPHGEPPRVVQDRRATCGRRTRLGSESSLPVEVHNR